MRTLRMKMVLHGFAVVALLVLSQTALAYIPPYWMVMSRLAENHGRGLYQIDQDVVFSHLEEPVIIHERWFILNENEMRVEITSKRGLKTPLRLVYIYDNGRRYHVDENGVLKSARAPEHFFEPYFHFRFSKNIKPTLVARKVVPAETLKSEPQHFNNKTATSANTRHEEAYMRLARVGGVIAYAVGRPTPAGSSEGYPGLWIEQDLFNILRLRFPDGVEVNASKYKTFSGGLSAPLEREVVVGGKTMKITLSQAQSVATNAKTKALLQAKSLNFGENPKVAAAWTDDALVRQFYTELR